MTRTSADGALGWLAGAAAPRRSYGLLALLDEHATGSGRMVDAMSPCVSSDEDLTTVTAAMVGAVEEVAA